MSYGLKLSLPDKQHTTYVLARFMTKFTIEITQYYIKAADIIVLKILMPKLSHS